MAITQSSAIFAPENASQMSHNAILGRGSKPGLCLASAWEECGKQFSDQITSRGIMMSWLLLSLFLLIERILEPTLF